MVLTAPALRLTNNLHHPTEAAILQVSAETYTGKTSCSEVMSSRATPPGPKVILFYLLHLSVAEIIKR
jgi:hypothetical protein